ncbi:MAG TPA: DUF3298 domain-containing protein [Candidatus Avamphibacillus sp.]|nr:DUF3298 domain-containing protein [Candidatus Avamphibacillus sp.]
MSIQTHVSIITRVYEQQGVMIYYPEVFGLENLHVQQTINYSIVQLAQNLINQQYQQQDVDHFAEMIGTYEIKTNERGILSLTLSNYAIAPQHANGLRITKSVTFDVKTGKTYQLKSLFKPGSDYVNVLSNIVRRQIEERDIPIINGFSQISPDQDYYIADKSLVLYFQPIEITPHYFGSPMFPISVYELADIIDEEGPLGRMMGS